MKKLIWLPFIGFFIGFVAHFAGSNVINNLMRAGRDTLMVWALLHILTEFAIGILLIVAYS